MTVQLDGLGRQGTEPPFGPATTRLDVVTAPEASSDGPVFVDESGRRSKKFRRLGWVLAIACAVYAVTLVAAVIGGNSSAPWLLIPGPADETQTDTTQVVPAPSSSTGPDGVPAAVPGVPAPTDSAGAVVRQPSGSGSSGAPAQTGAEPTASPGSGLSTGGTVVDKPDPKPPVVQPSGGASEPPPIPSTDPDPTVDPTTPTEEPTDPPVVDGGNQPLAAEGAQ
ncbi:hypothetical protein [Streptomyces sp. SP18CS02]|uniref:hypothetical protein n=1 Tax=Streptomyces sp. SP18CS02 TaxID=3002531 RepID=UPI002E76B5A7|nr:hypothetical protein [Streptomyces sp. SP18CS02]